MRNCCYASPRLNCCGLVAVKAACHWLKVIKSKFYSVTIVIVVVRCEPNSSLHRNDWNNGQHGGQEWGLQQSQGSEKLYTASGREVWLVSLIQAICVCRKAFYQKLGFCLCLEGRLGGRQRSFFPDDRLHFKGMVFRSSPPELQESYIHFKETGRIYSCKLFKIDALREKEARSLCISIGWDKW